MEDEFSKVDEGNNMKFLEEAYEIGQSSALETLDTTHPKGSVPPMAIPYLPPHVFDHHEDQAYVDHEKDQHQEGEIE